MSRARPKSQILATLWSVNRTFLAATSLWMHYETDRVVNTIITETKAKTHSETENINRILPLPLLMTGLKWFPTNSCSHMLMTILVLLPMFCSINLSAQSLTFLAARKSRPWATSKENFRRSSMSSGQSTFSSHKVSWQHEIRHYTNITEVNLFFFFSFLTLLMNNNKFWLENTLYLEMFPYLPAGRVSSPSRCLKKSWRSHCHWNHYHHQRPFLDPHQPPPDFTSLWWLPPDEVPLSANVLVFACVLHGVLHVHDKVDKCLCLMTKEVQQVTETAVLCYH